MPDPLDPADAIISAFTDMWKRTGAFLAVTAGAALLGWNIYNVPNVFASFVTLRFAAIRQAYESIQPDMIAGWFLLMVHSLFMLWTLPFVLFYVWLLVRLWRDGDLFQVLFLLAISHSVHVFVYLQATRPLSGGPLAGAIGLLVVAEAIPVERQALVEVWNRHGDSVDHPEDGAHHLSVLACFLFVAARRSAAGRVGQLSTDRPPWVERRLWSF